MTVAQGPIGDVVDRWHRYLDGSLPGGLDELLSDDVVFWSPIVFSPQRGKDITTMYLKAAGPTLAGKSSGDSPISSERRFRYVKEVVAGHQAILEFETYIGEIYVNGVDIITCDDAGKITEFKVMIRPLQAVNVVHEQMKAMLESMRSAGES